jgi:mannose-6-phosphate isomerase-like protein (cupin superfamily)
MVFSLQDYLIKLPLPATQKWPDGVWDIEAFKNGTMSLILYHPHVKDYQTTHEQDELYIVMSGNAELIIEGVVNYCKVGDVLFVPAEKDHRFENFSDDFITWAIFWGPKGGEK